MSFETLIETTLANPLAPAKDQRAIGYLGADVPVELLIAAQAHPIRLRGNASVATPHADRFIEESFSVTSRRVADQWLAGELDALEAVVFSRSDDSAQRLYYYVCELQRLQRCAGPRPLLFDVASIQRASSAAHTLQSTRALAAELGVTDEHLARASAQVERRSRLLKRLDVERAIGRVAGSLAHRVLRAAACRWTVELDDALERWLDSLVPGPVQRRLVLVGSEPIDEHLHETVEAAGASIIAEINEASTIEHAPLSHGDVLTQIAARCHRRMHEARAALGDSDQLTARVRALRPDGAILWLLASDTGLAWEVPRIEQALRNAGCPVLKLVVQGADHDASTLARLASFAAAGMEAQ